MIACSRKGCSNTELKQGSIVFKDGIPFCSEECAKSANVKPMPLHLEINPDRLMEELNLQCAGYLYLNFSLKEAQEKSIAALQAWIGKRKVTAIEVTAPELYYPPDIAMADYGFRIEGENDVEPNRP